MKLHTWKDYFLEELLNYFINIETYLLKEPRIESGIDCNTRHEMLIMNPVKQ